MELGGTYVFLYGVYSNPRSARGVKAAVFLRDALKGETVKCRILAYTADNSRPENVLPAESALTKFWLTAVFPTA